jgi:hypothetical protein
MQERIEEFIADAQKIVDNGRAATRCLEGGKRQDACNLISISHYALSHVQDALDEILRAFELDGVTPGRQRSAE